MLSRDRLHHALSAGFARVIALLLACISALLAVHASSAWADGDPASDVLATQSLFLPYDANLPLRQQAQLSVLLATAHRDGHPLRVAVIASADDLGSVSSLWHHPQSYAEFLGEELSLVYRGPLLVVMPNGFGLDHSAISRAAVRAKLADIPVPHSGAELGEDTLTAIERLQAAAGNPLSAPSVSVHAAPGSVDVVAWIIFVLGVALIAAAWTVSFRARGFKRTSSTTT